MDSPALPLDLLTEQEAAAYCRVALSTFREHAYAAGVRPRRLMGRKLYKRADLLAAFESAPEWQQSTGARAGRNTSQAQPHTSTGESTNSSFDAPLANLRPQRLRKYVPRKQQS